MNEKVQAKAKELAQEIAVSKEFINMRLAEEAAMNDPEMMRLSAKYYEKYQEMQDATGEDKPDFEKIAALSKELEQVQLDMRALPLAKAMQDARNIFTMMMNMINEELQSVISPESSGSGCSGNCSSCGGCH